MILLPDLSDGVKDRDVEGCRDGRVTEGGLHDETRRQVPRPGCSMRCPHAARLDERVRKRGPWRREET